MASLTIFPRPASRRRPNTWLGACDEGQRPVASHAYHQVRGAAKRWYWELQGTPYNEGLADRVRAGAWAIDEELINDKLEELLSDLGSPIELMRVR